MSNLQVKRTLVPYETATARIYLIGGSFCTVDSTDYEYLSRFCWRLDDSGTCPYAYRRYQNNGIVHTIKMHREIMNCPPDMETHHIDLNSLNDCRSNLVNLTTIDHRLAHFKSR
jgi:hypothetical protein